MHQERGLRLGPLSRATSSLQPLPCQTRNLQSELPACEPAACSMSSALAQRGRPAVCGKPAALTALASPLAVRPVLLFPRCCAASAARVAACSQTRQLRGIACQSASCSAAWPAPEEPQPQTQQQPQSSLSPAGQTGVFEALRRCRTLFSCMAFCAVYAFLSWGTAAGAPFAHLAPAVSEAGTSGAWVHAATCHAHANDP